MDGAGKLEGSLSCSRRSVTINIKRSKPHSRGEPTVSVYNLDYQEGMTLHTALEQICTTEDPSLAFRPFRCGKGSCMSCLVAVDGKSKQACATLLSPGDHLTVEPDQRRPLVRDLVTVP